MSGRIAAAGHARSVACHRSRTFFTWRRATAAFSNRRTTAAPGSRSLTINQPRRWARSQFRFQIRTSFMSAAAKDCIGLIFPLAMAFTNRPTPAKRGRISDCATASKSRSWRSIQKIRSACLSRWAVILTDQTQSAAFIDRLMAGKLSKMFCIETKTSARATFRSIRVIRASFMRRCGNRAKRPGRMAFSTARAAEFSNRLTAERRGSS